MSEWISVSEQPDDDQLVVFAEIEYGEIYASASGAFYGGSFHLDALGLEASNYDGGACISIDFTPTHWFPLPMPPKTKAP